MKNYSFEITVLYTGFSIILTETKTGKEKIFMMASGTLVGIKRHMKSLTDAQCDMWFK